MLPCIEVGWIMNIDLLLTAIVKIQSYWYNTQPIRKICNDNEVMKFQKIIETLVFKELGLLCRPNLLLLVKIMKHFCWILHGVGNQLLMWFQTGFWQTWAKRKKDSYKETVTQQHKFKVNWTVLTLLYLGNSNQSNVALLWVKYQIHLQKLA